MRHFILMLTISIVVLVVGCGNLGLSPVKSKLLNGGFVLYVSNQSFAITPVDIRIEIDGEVVVHEWFHVGNQHNWKGFSLNLPTGKHTLHISSRRGEAELTKEFEVTGKHWAGIDYWYYPKPASGPVLKHFSFYIQDRPIIFE